MKFQLQNGLFCEGNQNEKLASLIFSEIALNSAGQIDTLCTSLLINVTSSQDIGSLLQVLIIEHLYLIR
jgi:hypothetical protein